MDKAQTIDTSAASLPPWPQHGQCRQLHLWAPCLSLPCSCSVAPTALEIKPKQPSGLSGLVLTQPAQSSRVHHSAVHIIPLGMPTASSACRAVGVQGAGSPPRPALPARGSGTGGWAFLSPTLGPAQGCPAHTFGSGWDQESTSPVPGGETGTQGRPRLSLRAPGNSVVGPASRQASPLLLFRSRPGPRSPCSFTHSAVHSFTHSPVHSFAHSLIYSPTHSFIPSHTHSLTPSLPLSVAHGHLPGAGPPPALDTRQEGPGRLGHMCWEKQA